MNSTQLTTATDFDTSRLVFSKPEVGTIPGSKLTFKRIRLGMRNRDGTMGDLVVGTPDNLMSFGIQETTDQATGSVNGYQFPLVMWGRPQATEEEKQFTDMIHQITDACKTHLVEHRDEIEKYDLEISDLKKLNPLYYKMEKGKIIEDRSPIFYVKTYSHRKDNDIQIRTFFTDKETHEWIDPLTLMNKRCFARCAIKIESIFIGSKISIQARLYEASIRLQDSSFKSLLLRDA